MQGQCLCGDIKFEVKGAFKTVLNCHCDLCKRMNGSALSTYAVAAEQDFCLYSGKLKAVKETDRTSKHFCPNCGTPIYNKNPIYQGLAIIHIGILKEFKELTPAINIYCQNQLQWLNEISELPSFVGAIEQKR